MPHVMSKNMEKYIINQLIEGALHVALLTHAGGVDADQLSGEVVDVNYKRLPLTFQLEGEELQSVGLSFQGLSIPITISHVAIINVTHNWMMALDLAEIGVAADARILDQGKGFYLPVGAVTLATALKKLL